MLRLLTITERKEKTMARTPIHPGEILGDELEEIGLSAKKLAEVIKVPPNRLYQLLAGKRSITADTALRLSQYFGMSADFWMNLQSAYELDLARRQLGKTIQRIPKRSDAPVAPRPAA
jgi:addiction module HigA family antidote